MSRHPFRSVRHALGAVKAAHSGPKESRPKWVDRVQQARHDPERWLEAAALLFGPEIDDRGNQIGDALVAQGSAQEARILWWASHSDDATEADAWKDGGPGHLRPKDRWVIREFGDRLRRRNLCPDRTADAIKCVRRLWYELPNNIKHISTAVDDS